MDKSRQKDRQSSPPEQEQSFPGSPSSGSGGQSSREKSENTEGDGQGSPSSDANSKEKNAAQGSHQPDQNQSSSGGPSSGSGKENSQEENRDKGSGDQSPESQDAQAGKKESVDSEGSPSRAQPDASGEKSGQADDEKDGPESGKVKVEGKGKRPGVPQPPQSPHEARARARPRANSGEEMVADEGQTIEELENERGARKAGRNEEAVSGAKRNGRSSSVTPDASYRSPHGGLSDHKDQRPMVGDWSDYQGMVLQFAPEIRRLRDSIDRLRARQQENAMRAGPERNLLPEDGDMRRLNRQAHTRLIKKIIKNRGVGEDDARRFQADRATPTPSAMDVCLLIDGSGSMYDKFGSGHAPIEAGIHAGCLLNEACKSDLRTKRNVNFHLGLFGNATPFQLARPGDLPQDVGHRISGLRRSSNWGTSLAPSIRHMTHEISDTLRKAVHGNTSFSHIVILSDGDLADEQASFQAVSQLLSHCPYSSVDFMTVNDRANTSMQQMAAKLEQTFPGRVIVKHLSNPAGISQTIEELVAERVRQTPITQAITARAKRSGLERALDAMSR